MHALGEVGVQGFLLGEDALLDPAAGELHHCPLDRLVVDVEGIDRRADLRELFRGHPLHRRDTTFDRRDTTFDRRDTTFDRFDAVADLRRDLVLGRPVGDLGVGLVDPLREPRRALDQAVDEPRVRLDLFAQVGSALMLLDVVSQQLHVGAEHVELTAACEVVPVLIVDPHLVGPDRDVRVDGQLALERVALELAVGERDSRDVRVGVVADIAERDHDVALDRRGQRDALNLLVGRRVVLPDRVRRDADDAVVGPGLRRRVAGEEPDAEDEENDRDDASDTGYGDVATAIQHEQSSQHAHGEDREQHVNETIEGISEILNFLPHRLPAPVRGSERVGHVHVLVAWHARVGCDDGIHDHSGDVRGYGRDRDDAIRCPFGRDQHVVEVGDVRSHLDGEFLLDFRILGVCHVDGRFVLTLPVLLGAVGELTVLDLIDNRAVALVHVDALVGRLAARDVQLDHLRRVAGRNARQRIREDGELGDLGRGLRGLGLRRFRRGLGRGGCRRRDRSGCGGALARGASDLRGRGVRERRDERENQGDDDDARALHVCAPVCVSIGRSLTGEPVVKTQYLYLNPSVEFKGTKNAEAESAQRSKSN